MTQPGWHRDANGQLRWWDGQQWGHAIPWSVDGQPPAFAAQSGQVPRATRSAGKAIAVGAVILVGLVITGLIAVGFVQSNTESPRAVAQRFVDEFLSAEGCTDRVVQVANQDSTDRFRDGGRVDCTSYSFSPNPPGFAMTVDSVTQTGGDKAAVTVRVSSYGVDNGGEIRLSMRRIDGRWLVDEYRQIALPADVL